MYFQWTGSSLITYQEINERGFSNRPLRYQATFIQTYTDFL